jgi:hypothetical protein
MTQYSASIAVNAASLGTSTSSPSPLNIAPSDTISATITTTNSQFTDWLVYATSNCTLSRTSGSFGTATSTTTITPTAGSSSYYVDFSTSRTVRNGIATLYGRIQGSIIATADDVPNTFTFTNQTQVPLSTLTVSNAITVSGINTATKISVSSNSAYNIDGGSYTSVDGTVTNNQVVTVRHTSSPNYNANTITTLNIGGVIGTFTSTTTGTIPATYGLRIYDQSGNITLDTTDETMKDLGVYTISSVTTNQTISGIPSTNNTIALVNNNNGDGNTAIAAPVVTVNPSTSSVVVSGGQSGFNVSIRLMEF